MKVLHTSLVKCLLLVMFMIIADVGTCHPSSTPVVGDPTAQVLNAFKTNDLVFLGTRHRQLPILNFISNLLPRLPAAGVRYVGLEIASDQQSKIDSFMKTGVGLDRVRLSPIIDCPEYRNLLTIIREHGLQPVALDLPKSMWKNDWTRDHWMANRVVTSLDHNIGAKMLTVVGNHHVLKAVEWEDPENNKQFIPACVRRLRPAVKMYSIAECIGDSPTECGFRAEYGARGDLPQAVETLSLENLELGFIRTMAIKPMTAEQAVDAVIIH